MAMANISLYLLTFNCARNLVQPHKLAPHIFDALPQNVPTPDVLVLSLQEIAPIAYSFLGGSFLTPYFTALREAVKLVAKDHVNVVSRNLGLTAIMIFVKDPARISWVETAGVGVGLQEMGNKGAVSVRLVYAETHLTFVAAHLAPMESQELRRNEDWKNIVKGLVFAPEARSIRGDQDEDMPLLQGLRNEDSSGAGIYNTNSHLFVAGDLNYRVSKAKPAATDVQIFPQPTDDLGSPKHFRNMVFVRQTSISHPLTNSWRLRIPATGTGRAIDGQAGVTEFFSLKHQYGCIRRFKSINTISSLN